MLINKIIILGDSLSSIKEDNKRPETGWGEELLKYFSCPVVNLAKNGRSTKSFINEGLVNNYINTVEENDLVLIQFGHNDQKIEDSNRYTDPNSSYQENLELFIKIAKNKNAIPVILSSISRLKYNNGNLDEKDLIHYHNAGKKVSQKNNISFIPMYLETIKLYKRLGINNTPNLFLHLEKNEHINYPEGIIDNTHLNDFGAKIISNLVVKQLLDNNIIDSKNINREIYLNETNEINLYINL